MLRMTKMAVVAALLLATGSTAAQDDPEAGDVRVDLSARKTPAPVVREDRDDAPVVTTRRRAGEVGPLRFYGGFNVSIGGELQVERRVRNLFTRSVTDLDPTVGLQMGADYVLHQYFSIGGEMRFLWWKVDGISERDFLWDLVVKPRGRYAFHDLPLEVYGTMPLGLTVAGLQDPFDGGAGFNIGLLAGVNYFFNEHMGINAEIGWQFHRFNADVDARVVGVDISGDAGAWKLNQFVLLCPNFVYAL
jgi:hypothetical protein